MEKHRGVWMSKRGSVRYEVISQFVAGKLSRKEASDLLDMRERTVSRLARRYETKGLVGMEHGNRQHKPHNLTPETLKDDVMRLVKRRYYDFNMTHALERLAEDHGLVVTRETFRRWCHEAGVVKRAKRRKGIARKHRERMPSEGLMLQMDGSEHEFVARKNWHLIAAIDDATSEIPHAEFFDSESTINCMKVLHSVIAKKGIPYALYLDQAGCFGGPKRVYFNQFRRACEELEIRLLFAMSPQAKGRIERAWDTFQDRIVPELRINEIWRIDKANEYLHGKFLPNYWERKCRVEPRDPQSKYRPLPSHLDLKEIFCVKERRKVNGDHTISWNGVTYALQWPKKRSIRGHLIEFRTYSDGRWRVFHADDPVAVEPVCRPARVDKVSTAQGVG